MGRWAVGWALLALVGASIEPVLVKFGYRAEATAWQFLAAKNLVAAVAIVPLTRRLAWVGWRGAADIARVSVLLLATNALGLLSLERIPAVTFVTVVATTPALVAIAGRARRSVRLARTFWLGFAMCFVGIALSFDLLDSPYTRPDATGVVLAAGAVVSSTIYRTLLEGVAARHGPALVSTYVFGIDGAITLICILPWVGVLPRAAWGYGLWIGVAAAVANVAFVAALHALGATRISIFTLLQRPLVILAAAVLLGERLGWLQMAGIGLVLAGVALARADKVDTAPEQRG